MAQHIELLRTSSTIERAFAAAGVVTFAAGSLFVWYFDPTTNGFFPACPLYTTTGFACPGCGLTRGFHALFHGDIITALDYNALIPLVILFFGYLLVGLLSIAIRGRGSSNYQIAMPDDKIRAGRKCSDRIVFDQ